MTARRQKHKKTARQQRAAIYAAARKDTIEELIQMIGRRVVLWLLYDDEPKTDKS
jgi:RNA-binding protein YhbY